MIAWEIFRFGYDNVRDLRYVRRRPMCYVKYQNQFRYGGVGPWRIAWQCHDFRRGKQISTN